MGAVVLALALVEVDRVLQGEGVRSIPLVPLVADLSATGGRAILAAIGGTMLAPLSAVRLRLAEVLEVD